MSRSDNFQKQTVKNLVSDSPTGILNERKNDTVLWNDFRKGEEAAFIHIYKTYFDVLMNYGLQFFQESSSAEDFVQDLFIDLRCKRRKLKPIRNSVKAFLLVALKNKILDYKRKQLVRNKNMNWYFKEFEFIQPFEDQLIKTQEYQLKIEKLKSGLSKLTSRQREAIYYLYYENLSYAEISEIMRIDHVKSVRNMVYKAFGVLKPMLKMIIGFIAIFA